MQANSKKTGTQYRPAKEAAGKDSFESVAKHLECDKDKARFEGKPGKLVKTGRAKRAKE
jgi:hypothetical protein